jgi:protein phosphatase
MRGANFYRVSDTQGFRRCWACGSASSVEGDTYCVECGAQLTDRYYRLQELHLAAPPDSDGQATSDPDSTSALPLPDALLENSVPGVSRVYDRFDNPHLGRAYVVWEEAYGRTLASWLPGGDDTGALLTMSPIPTSGYLLNLEEPGEEQALAWMAEAADVLASLHSQNVVGCDLTLNNLVVQPGDRVVMLDPTGGRAIEPEGDTGELAMAQQSDIRTLARVLESWYLAVREDPHLTATHVTGATDTAALVAASDDVTGPLKNPLNPVVVFAKAREGAYATAEELAQALYELYEATRPVTNLQFWSGRATDVGQVRQVNEDSLLTLEANILEHEGNMPVGLYVVADGMGGHQSGEVASSIAIRTIGSIVNTSLIAPLVAGDPVACDPNTCGKLLQQAVIEANRRIADLARERHSDLGTTVTVALLVGNQLTVANVGDSRTYVWRDNQLGVVTRDHSLVAQLVAAGQIAPNEIYTHPRRNEIYRALGDPHLTSAEVDTFSHLLQPGDGVLLCSDGLWDFVRDPIINAMLGTSADKDPRVACQDLVDRANSMGGEDNISTIYVRVLATEEES